jgi:predicted MFS family arabinose efflux permease
VVPTINAHSRRLLRLTALVSTLDRFAMPPMLVAIAADLDVPLGSVVHAAGAYFLTYGLLQPVWGSISDRLGLVRTLRLSMLLAAVATTASAFAGSVVALAVARGVAGACFSAAIPATLVYVGDTVPAERRQRDVTDLMSGVAVGTALAAACAGVLAQHLSWRAAFVVTGAAALALTVALRRLDEPPRMRAHRGAVRPLLEVLSDGPARLVLLLALGEGVVLLGVLTLLPSAIESTGASASVAGLVTAVYGVSVLVSARLVGRLSHNIRPATLVAVGASAAVAACLIAALSTVVLAGVAVAALVGVAWAAMHSTFQTWATEVLPSARATAVSLFAASLFVGSALGALLTGGLAQDGRYREIFLVAAAAAVPLGFAGALGRGRWTPAAPA